jgi:hypothetical protein
MLAAAVVDVAHKAELRAQAATVAAAMLVRIHQQHLLGLVALLIPAEEEAAVDIQALLTATVAVVEAALES